MYEKELTFNFEITESYPLTFTVTDLEKPWTEMTEDEKTQVIEENWLAATQEAERETDFSLGQLISVVDEDTDEEIDCYD